MANLDKLLIFMIFAILCKRNKVTLYLDHSTKRGILKLGRQEGVGGQLNVYAYKVNDLPILIYFVCLQGVGGWSKKSKILST